MNQSDIDNGRTCSTSLCPVALCVARHLPNAREINAGSHHVWIDGICVITPLHVRQFIKNFDHTLSGSYQRRNLQPINFSLPIEEQLNA